MIQFPLLSHFLLPALSAAKTLDQPVGDEEEGPKPTSVMGRALEMEVQSQKIHVSLQAPNDWRLSEFYDESSFPVRLFLPKIFLGNQKELKKKFVIDDMKSKEQGVGFYGKSVLFGGGNSGTGTDGETEGNHEGDGNKDPNEEGLTPGDDDLVGTGPDDDDSFAPGKVPSILGLDRDGKKVHSNTFYWMEFLIVINQPIVVHSTETREADIRRQLRDRYGEHFPLHRIGVICCSMTTNELSNSHCLGGED